MQPVNEPPTARAGNLVFASGQIACDNTGVAAETRIDPAFPYYGSAIKNQTRYILDKLAKAFTAQGTGLEHCVKAHVFHTDLRNFDAFDEVWREYFPKMPPCRATVGMGKLLVPGCLLQVDLIAAMPSAAVRSFTTNAPRAPVNYSEGIVVDDFIFASGLMASDYKTGVPVEARVDPAFPYYGSSIKRQTRYIMDNFKSVFEAAGSSLANVVKAHVYLKDLHDFNGYDEIWKEYFPSPPPRTTVGAPDLLVRDALVEIDLVAVTPKAKRELISVPDIPKPLAHYAPAVRVNDLVFAAGALATDFKTGVAPECKSARGPDTDRHAKLLIHLAVEGSLFGAYSHREAHLRWILGAYATYYNQSRTHRFLNKDAPFHRAIERLGAIASHPILGGLHHQYCRI